MPKHKTGLPSYPTHNNKLKMLSGPKCETETIKVFKGNTVGNLSDMGFSIVFLGLAPEARKAKADINYQDQTEIEKLSG